MKVRVNAKKAADWAKRLEDAYIEFLSDSDAISDLENEALDAVLNEAQHRAVFEADGYVPVDQVFDIRISVRPRHKQDWMAKAEK